MNIQLIAMDLDGTLTQHKTPLSPEHRAVLTKLSEKYKLLMVGAGQVMRIFNQMEQFPWTSSATTVSSTRSITKKPEPWT